MVVDASSDRHGTPKVGLNVYVTDPGDAGYFCTVASIRLIVGSTAVDPHCANAEVQP